MNFTETFEDPAMIKNMIVEIRKFADLKEYQEIKKIDRLQFEFALRDIFPTFSEEHPFLFRKIVLGDDLTFLYSTANSTDTLFNGKKQLN